MMYRQNRFPKRQSGTILITVVLIAAVVIVLVVESVKTVRYQKQLSNNLIHRDQAYSYLMGMEELAKIWLAKSFEESESETVHLNQPWAQDNITFPLEGGGMIASIKDMQSCFNLNSIASEESDSERGGRNNDSRGKDEPERRSEFGGGVNQKTPGQEILEDLLSKVNENGGAEAKALSTAVRDWIDEDIEPSGADGAEDEFYQGLEIPYRTSNSLLSHVSELRAIKGFNQKVYNILMPFVCVLPDQDAKKINVNTVNEESAYLLYAVLGAKDITMSDVSKAISNRGEEGYEKVEDFFDEFGAAGTKIREKYGSRVDVTSKYFQMTAKAEIGKTRVTMKSLLKKSKDNNFQVISRYFGKE
ncbi:type II secretion system minor pseudopilin GspK [Aliikangiella sp. IMCC44359]|uniref:type II secretion system minor pseudopilin GspK n=1 Tax=Aliikangiella sp. IMCC44359 TaxID=3459125 RepID=UPI00403A994B